MKNFLKKSIATGVVFNGLTTVAKSIFSAEGVKKGMAELGKDSLKVFATSFITSTLPAVLANMADKSFVQNYTDNKVVQHVALAAESIALTHVTSICTKAGVLQFTMPKFGDLINSSHFSKDFALDAGNTWAQAEVMKYLDLFSSDEVLHPELV